jgi:transposase
MLMLADTIDAVVGGDTHRDSRALEIASPTGTPIATLTLDNDDRGFAQALAWIVTHAPRPEHRGRARGHPQLRHGLARALQAAGLPVIEVARPRREERRRGKSDPIDAHLAVLHALRMPADRLPTPRADGDREALRILLAARRDLTLTKTAQTNRLRALLLGGDDGDRALARSTLTQARLALITQRRGRPTDTLEQQIRRGEAQRLARAIRQATSTLAQNTKQLADLVTALAPALLDATGVGPVSAAQALVSWTHRGRCRNDAAFAALAGACPIPASSGRTVRHRLNRGGDRQLNRALHDVLLTRLRICPRTHAYITRRRAEGKTDPEIRRCLKRHIARELFRTMHAATALDAT